MRLTNSVSCLQAKTESMSVPGCCRRERVPSRLAHCHCPSLLPSDPEEFLVCFASTRFRFDTITLPLSNLEWRSLKTELRQHSLPKVQFATSGLPTGYSSSIQKRQAVYA